MPQLSTIQDLQKASKGIQSEVSSLHPSALITLFEIDVSELAKSQNVSEEIINNHQDKYRTIFRFHNQVKAFNGANIIWSGKDGVPKTYIAAPIQAIGFEYNAKGTLPTPRLSITANEESVLYLDVFKQRLLQYGDLCGAKVTRIRTFAKYLDSINFGGEGSNPDEDWTKEFPRDVFYIDRKTVENKYVIEFELASVLDVEGLVLPQRLVLSKCSFQYRGCGCSYEYASRQTAIHEGAHLPKEAPPIATATDELIVKILGTKTLTDQGKFNSETVYSLGDYCYIEKDLIKYYYVSKINDNKTTPPDSRYWIEEACSKLVKGCKIRWQTFSLDLLRHEGIQRGNIPINVLPYGGFPSVAKYGFNLF